MRYRVNRFHFGRLAKRPGEVMIMPRCQPLAVAAESQLINRERAKYAAPPKHEISHAEDDDTRRT